MGITIMSKSRSGHVFYMLVPRPKSRALIGQIAGVPSVKGFTRSISPTHGLPKVSDTGC